MGVAESIDALLAGLNRYIDVLANETDGRDPHATPTSAGTTHVDNLELRHPQAEIGDPDTHPLSSNHRAGL